MTTNHELWQPYIKRLSADAFDTIMALDDSLKSQISGPLLSPEEKQAMVKGELDKLKKAVQSCIGTLQL